MGMHSADLDVASALATPRSCPACGVQRLVPLTDRGVVVLTCLDCQQGWTLELGRMVPVGPDRCLACTPDRACPSHSQVPRQGDAT